MSSALDVELRKEASVMAMYVAVCLLAALIALGEDADHGHVRAFGLVWGTTLGLALAHAFAFRVSARLVAGGKFSRADAQIVLAQLTGATFVAAIATLPVVVFGSTAEFDVVRTVLSVFIGAMGYAVGRLSGAGRTRSLMYGGAVLLLAMVIAVIKNILSGH
jgi:hypothetical protein